MAPTFRHGKGTVVLIDQFNMSPFLNASTISASVDTAETTTYGNNDKTYIGGLRDVTLALGGLFAFTTGTTGPTHTSTSIDAEFDQALGGSTKWVVTWGPEGDTVGRRAMLMTGDAVKYDISSPVTNLVSIAADVHGSQGYRGGRWLKNVASVNATGSGAGVLCVGTTAAGGTTSGGTAHLHVTAESGVTSATFKVQHSTSGSTWATLITFTNATGVTFQRSTVAGTVKEQTRATLSAITGGGSLSYAVAFARNGRNQ